MEKIICEQCGKEDFKGGIMKDGKMFCCVVCGESYETEHEDEKGEGEEKGVCMFC